MHFLLWASGKCELASKTGAEKSSAAACVAGSDLGRGWSHLRQPAVLHNTMNLNWSSTDFLLWKNTWPLPLARQSLVLAGAAVAKVWPGDLFFKGKGLWSHNYCQHNIKSWFVTFAFSQVYRGCMTCDITTEQLWERPWSSINPDSKAVCKKYKQCHSSQIFLF